MAEKLFLFFWENTSSDRIGIIRCEASGVPPRIVGINVARYANPRFASFVIRYSDEFGTYRTSSFLAPVDWEDDFSWGGYARATRDDCSWLLGGVRSVLLGNNRDTILR